MNDRNIIIHDPSFIVNKDVVSFGHNIAIGPFFYMTTRGEFLDWIHISSHVSVIGGKDATLYVGNNVAISTGCRLVCRSNDFHSTKPAIPFKEGPKDLYGNFITLKDNVILGANVVVLPDVIIGEGAVVGANSLVKTHLEPWSIYAGTPVKKIGERHD